MSLVLPDGIAELHGCGSFGDLFVEISIFLQECLGEREMSAFPIVWHIYHAWSHLLSGQSLWAIQQKESRDQSQKDMDSAPGHQWLAGWSWASHSIFLNLSFLISTSGHAVPILCASWHCQEASSVCWTVELQALMSGRTVFESHSASYFSKPPVSHL